MPPRSSPPAQPSAADQGTDALDALGGRADQAAICRRGDRRLREEEPRHQDQGILVREERALCALKTALRAGQAPDIFYAEPDQTEYYENSFLLDLSDLNWANIEPWAKQAWSYKGKPYGLPLEAWTVELYYNKKLMDELGVKVPENLQLSGDAFLDMVKKAKAKGIVPMSLGSGDRPFTGAHLTHEALLQKLGIDDYDKLLTRQAAMDRPARRRHAEMGSRPGRRRPAADHLHVAQARRVAHLLPHQAGRATFLNGSWYTSRAFNAPDQGGQPVGFPLGIMKFPAVPGAACPECRSIAVGGSYVINAETKHAKEASRSSIPSRRPRWATSGSTASWCRPASRAIPRRSADRTAEYFKMIEASNRGAKYYFGIPIQVMQGKPKEVFTQVINMAFPAGTIDVDGVVKQMGAAY